MIQKESILKISDNCGGKLGRCIGLFSKKNAKLLNFIILSIKSFAKRYKRRTVLVKKSVVYKGIILSLNFFKMRFNGIFLKFDFNRVILVKNLYKLLSSKIYGPANKELRNYSFINSKKFYIYRVLYLKVKYVI